MQSKINITISESLPFYCICNPYFQSPCATEKSRIWIYLLYKCSKVYLKITPFSVFYCLWYVHISLVWYIYFFANLYSMIKCWDFQQWNYKLHILNLMFISASNFTSPKIYKIYLLKEFWSEYNDILNFAFANFNRNNFDIMDEFITNNV